MREQNFEVDGAGEMKLDAKLEAARNGRAMVLVETSRHSYLGTLDISTPGPWIMDVLCGGRRCVDLVDVSTDGVAGLEPRLTVDKAMIRSLHIIGIPTHAPVSSRPQGAIADARERLPETRLAVDG